MNDPPLLTPYWSSAFAKQMKPPTLAPYMVALLCMGPCHGQAHTRDPTIGFPLQLSYIFRLVIFSAWCKQCLTFPPFIFCHVKHFAVSTIQTLILFFSHISYMKWIVIFTLTEVTLRTLFKSGFYKFIAQRQPRSKPRVKSWHFLNAAAPLPCVSEGGGVYYKILLQIFTQCKKYGILSFCGSVSDEALSLVCKVLIVTLWPLFCSLIGLCRRGCALVN